MADSKIFGYEDTPMLPGMNYRVHDGARPQPRVVNPGTASTQEQPGVAPSDATILFDGSTLAEWCSLDGSAARWKLENGYMEVAPGAGDIRTRLEFGDCQVHVEWASPTVVNLESRSRGNSGVFMMGLYEIQVLDCYENPIYPDGAAAAIYGQFPPLVNACRKPGEWQTYDIVWESPRFDGDTLVRPAYVTVFHNGVLVHNHTALLGPTQYRKLAHYVPQALVGPLQLQDHGDTVRFRNIWCRPLKGYDQP